MVSGQCFLWLVLGERLEIEFEHNKEALPLSHAHRGVQHRPLVLTRMYLIDIICVDEFGRGFDVVCVSACVCTCVCVLLLSVHDSFDQCMCLGRFDLPLLLVKCGDFSPWATSRRVCYDPLVLATHPLEFCDVA